MLLNPKYIFIYNAMYSYNYKTQFSNVYLFLNLINEN